MTAQTAHLFIDHEELLLTRDGRWLANGEEITHEQTCRLFSRSIRRDPDGYLIQVKHETKRIRVEDTPYFVIGLSGNATAGFDLILSDESREKLDVGTLTYHPGRLVCRVKGATEEAKFLSTSYFEILANLEEDDTSYFLNLENQRVVLSAK